MSTALLDTTAPAIESDFFFKARVLLVVARSEGGRGENDAEVISPRAQAFIHGVGIADWLQRHAARIIFVFTDLTDDDDSAERRRQRR